VDGLAMMFWLGDALGGVVKTKSALPPRILGQDANGAFGVDDEIRTRNFLFHRQVP
jgi:hypothetical protein